MNKIGSLMISHWAGEENPMRYFIYTGIKGDYATGLYLMGRELKEVKYNRFSFLNSREYESIGYCNAFDIMKEDLKMIQNKHNIKPEFY